MARGMARCHTLKLAPDHARSAASGPCSQTVRPTGCDGGEQRRRPPVEMSKGGRACGTEVDEPWQGSGGGASVGGRTPGPRPRRGRPPDRRGPTAGRRAPCRRPGQAHVAHDDEDLEVAVPVDRRWTVPGVNHTNEPGSSARSRRTRRRRGSARSSGPAATAYASVQTEWTWGVPPRRPSGPSLSLTRRWLTPTAPGKAGITPRRRGRPPRARPSSSWTMARWRMRQQLAQAHRQRLVEEERGVAEFDQPSSP